MSLAAKPALVVEGRAGIAVWERGAGPAVLCVHGFPDHAVGLLPMADALASAGFRALVPALPGYFPSAPVPDGDYSVDAVCSDLLAVLDRLGVEEAALVGHDWGAVIGYHLGSTRPERVSAVVALSVPHPSGFRLRRTVLAEQMTAAYAWVLAYGRRRLEVAADPEWLTALAQDWSPGLFREDWPEILEILTRPEVAEAVCGYYRCDLDGAGPPTGTVRVPTTIVHGGQDGCIRPSLYEGLETSFAAGLERHLLPAVGHWPQLEDPAAVEALVLDGLRGVPKSGLAT